MSLKGDWPKHKEIDNQSGIPDHLCFRNKGYNQAIDDLSKLELVVDEGKLTNIIYNESLSTKEVCSKIANAIIAALPDILEVKNAV